MMSHLKLRRVFADFWGSKRHVEIPGIPLILQNDPTTLFTGSGMQQLVPNLLGEPHPLGTRLYNIQRCVRAQDIDDVGDNRHDTFFEMMGNWSLGDYFKKEQLRWVFDLYTNKEIGFGLDPVRLYVTVFGGGEGIPKDEESIALWKELFAEKGIATDVGTVLTFQSNQHITLYGANKNWWSRSGAPDQMPAGEVGGPDSEIFYDFGPERNLHETAMVKDAMCHANCDCGRFLEIGNSVFVQYVKQADGLLQELPKKNVDFGGGLERVLAAIHDDPDVFETDVFAPIMKVISPEYTTQTDTYKRRIRIVTDHIRTAVQLASDGVVPSAKEQGYVMRSLIRRAVLNANAVSISNQTLINAIRAVMQIFGILDSNRIENILIAELQKYKATVESGKKELRKKLAKQPHALIGGDAVFEIYQSTGLPPEVIVEIGTSVGAVVNLDGFEEAKAKHSELSRSRSEQKFKGGLADKSEQVIKYHTATHLLHQALCDVLGDSIRQEGSNITGERLRFDFRCDHRPTSEDMEQVSSIIQSKIHEALPMSYIMMPKDQAESLGAKSFFKEKYPDMVKVYFIGQSIESAYSKEFCGGPHVKNTKEIGTIALYKIEKIGKDLYRVYAKT